MKLIILLCVFTAIFSMQEAEGYVNPFQGITNLKNRVNSEISDLSRYNNNLEFNLKLKLSNLKLSQMQNVNNAVNPALTDIQNAIAAAKQEGRNADSCYEPARQQLRDASNAAFSALDKCVDDQLATLGPVKLNIESHLSNGKLLLSNLDSIAISCSSGNAMQAQLCVAQKMPAASASVQTYEATAKQLKSTGDSLSSSGEAGAIRCFQPPMSTLFMAVASVRTSANTCVKNAK